MGKSGLLGSFEEMVLLATVHCGVDAYAVTIRRELAERTGADVSVGAVYATLDRLERKNYVRSFAKPNELEHRGRPRRYYQLLPGGRAALLETRVVREAFWNGVPRSIAGARRP